MKLKQFGLFLRVLLLSRLQLPAIPFLNRLDPLFINVQTFEVVLGIVLQDWAFGCQTSASANGISVLNTLLVIRIEQCVLGLQNQFGWFSSVPVVHFRRTLRCLFTAGASLHLGCLSEPRRHWAAFYSLSSQLHSLLYRAIGGLYSFELQCFTLLTQLSLLFGFKSFLLFLLKCAVSLWLLFTHKLLLNRFSLSLLFLALLAKTRKLVHEIVCLCAKVFLNIHVLNAVHYQGIPFKSRLFHQFRGSRRLLIQINS